MRLAIVLLLSSLVFVGGCATSTPPLTAENDSKYRRLFDQYWDSPESVSYVALWHAYMASSQIADVSELQENYTAIMQSIDSGELTCAEVDWEEITLSNFWSIKPHISAQSCYEQTGNTPKAAFHAYTTEFLLSGILSSGDGENYYSAYEIGAFFDASDVIELSEYEVVDHYFELLHYEQALYFVYVVNDPDTGIQRKIYFENNKFLHKIMGVQYPFVGLGNRLRTDIVTPLAQDYSYAKLAVAHRLALEGDDAGAIKTYLDAANNGSALAYYLLGILCHTADEKILPRSECINYVFQSAEAGLVNASIAIAFIYKEGIEVDKDETIFSDIMASAEHQLEPGDAWFKFALLYKGILGVSDEQKHKQYLIKAAEKGSQKAALANIKLELKEFDYEDEEKSQTMESRLEAIANTGLDSAQYSLAKWLMRTNDTGTDKYNSAMPWIEKSAEQGNPNASHLLGRAHQTGLFGEEDSLKAYLAYNSAALNYYPSSQLQVGYFNGKGLAVVKNDRLALSWYLLCSKAYVLACVRNVGIYLRDGIVVERNYQAALENFKYASDQGHYASTTSLALLYLKGHGVEVDAEKANELLMKTCHAANDKANGEACSYLAENYSEGTGVEMNLDTAKQLFEKSCNNGYSWSCNKINGLTQP